MQNTPEENALVDKYMPEVFNEEAKALLQQLMVVPEFLAFLLSIPKDEAKNIAAAERAQAYIVEIFEQSYRAGALRVSIFGTPDELYGYAMTFTHPERPELPAHVHALYVYPEYRKQGVGSMMLQTLSEDPNGITLLCLPADMPFYSARGYSHKLMFSGQGAPEHMSKTKAMYAGYMLMVSPNASTHVSSIFMLNDGDLAEIKKRMKDEPAPATLH